MLVHTRSVDVMSIDVPLATVPTAASLPFVPRTTVLPLAVVVGSEGVARVPVLRTGSLRGLSGAGAGAGAAPGAAAGAAGASFSCGCAAES